MLIPKGFRVDPQPNPAIVCSKFGPICPISGQYLMAWDHTKNHLVPRKFVRENFDNPNLCSIGPNFGIIGP